MRLHATLLQGKYATNCYCLDIIDHKETGYTISANFFLKIGPKVVFICVLRIKKYSNETKATLPWIYISKYSHNSTNKIVTTDKACQEGVSWKKRGCVIFKVKCSEPFGYPSWGMNCRHFALSSPQIVIFKGTTILNIKKTARQIVLHWACEPLQNVNYFWPILALAEGICIITRA